ncbi:MAG: ATP-binding domain-containing protein [Thermoflavifilum sp.]|nr:ATP-binding domain-containing protein [Thermoflavifilum sp.]MCL6514951.1 AAA family ATPase [Alicyclobacillus sp.]
MADEAVWREESAYLARVIQVVRDAIRRIEHLAQQQRHSVLEERRYVWENVTHDSSTPESAAIQALHLTGLIDEEREYLVYRRVIDKLERIAKSPYFGRMDWREQGAETAERIYIGISSLRDPKDETPLIYDWRAPISSMFYDYTPGPAQYESPMGPVQGEMTLKRQFQIADGQLKGVFDTDVRIGDEVLQALLARHADQRMTSIVSTIQREQNQAIRDLGHRLFIVSGPAGSGKTSVALQRVAFLLYHLRGRVTAEEILLLSPNRMFEDYVSGVLPELGEENMQQSTFVEQVERVLQPPVTFEDFYAQLDRWLSGKLPIAAQTAVRVKLSDGFAALMRAYLAKIAKEGPAFEDIVYRGQVVFRGETLRRRFCGELAKYRIAARMQHLRRAMEQRIREIQDYNRKRYEEKLFAKTQYVGTDEEIRRMAKAQADRHARELREMVHRTWRILPLRLYHDLFATPALLESLAPPELEGTDWDAVRSATLPALAAALQRLGRPAAAVHAASSQVGASGRGDNADPASTDDVAPVLPYDDLPALSWLYAQMLGPVKPQPMRHVLVDEAQDYTVLQFETLAALYPYASFTVLGDARQSVHPFVPAGGFERMADHVLSHLTQPHSHGALGLSKSYRSTAEILAFAEHAARSLGADVLAPAAGAPAEAVRRGHPRPRLCVLGEEADRQVVARQVLAETERLRSEEMVSIAIVCRTDAETETLAEALRPALPEIRRLRRSDEVFQTGTVVVPSYLAKGLEYDAVIVADADAYRSGESALLYTVCTRALHRLTLISRGKPAWLMNTPPHLFVEA